MDLDTTTKTPVTQHNEDVGGEKEIETTTSLSAKRAQKTLVRKLDCTLLPLFAIGYLLAYMVCITVHHIYVTY